MLTRVLYVAVGARSNREFRVSYESLRSIGGCGLKVSLVSDCHPGTVPPGVDLIPTGTVQAGEAASLRLTAFEMLPDAEAVFYMDSDVVVTRPFKFYPEVAGVCDPGKVNFYGYPDRSQDHKWGAGLLTRDPEVLAHRAFCSGMFYARRTPLAMGALAAALEVYRGRGSYRMAEGVWDQPSVCLAMIERSAYTLDLTPLVSEARGTACLRGSGRIFTHFCGLRGVSREAKMRRLLDQAYEKHQIDKQPFH